MPTETSSCSSSPSFGGTIRWMSPELLNPDERREPLGRTPHSDRYAFGMVIYEVRTLSQLCCHLFTFVAHPFPKVLTGNTPFHLLSDPAVIAKVVRGGRPEIPADTPIAARKSGLWTAVQRCWEEEPFKRPALSEVRDRLVAAAGMWDDDLGRSGSTGGYVSVAQNILLSSDDSSDPGKWIGFSLHLRFCSCIARER